MYVTFTPWSERTGQPGPEPGGDPRATSWARCQAGPRGDRSSPSRRRPSWAWAWRAASRCSSRTAAASASSELQQVARRDGPRRQRPDRPDGAPEHLPRGRPDDLRRRRPGEGQEPGRAARRGLRHAPDGARLGLRQRLQQVRPDATRSGSRPTSGSGSSPRTSAGSRSATGRGRWSRWARSSRSRSGSARRSSRGTTSTPRPSINGEAAPGLQLGPGAEAHGADGRAQAARRRWATSGPACRTRRSGSARRRSTSSRWRC